MHDWMNELLMNFELILHILHTYDGNILIINILLFDIQI